MPGASFIFYAGIPLKESKTFVSVRKPSLSIKMDRISRIYEPFFIYDIIKMQWSKKIKHKIHFCHSIISLQILFEAVLQMNEK